MKKKFQLIIPFLFLLAVSGYSQTIWTLKGGAGTSWVILPKVFLVDEADASNVWTVAPATNSLMFYAGVEALMPLSEHWFFLPQANLNYLSGEISVTSVRLNYVSRKMQSYTRLEIPLLFAVKSSDNFWFTFGPNIFLTLNDNKGFDAAVKELTTVAKINSKQSVGIRAHLGVATRLSEKLFLEIKFDYDLNKKFTFEGDTYEVRLAMQSISAGLGWQISK